MGQFLKLENARDAVADSLRAQSVVLNSAKESCPPSASVQGWHWLAPPVTSWHCSARRGRW